MFLAKTEQIAVVPLRTQLFVHMVTIAKTAMSEAKLWSFMAEWWVTRERENISHPWEKENVLTQIHEFGKGRCDRFYRRVQNMKFITMMACLKIDLPPGVRAMDWTWNCQVLWPQHGVHDLRHDEYHYGVSVNFYRFHDAWESKRLIFQPFPGGSWSLGWCSRSFLFGLPIPKQPEPGKQPHRLSQQQPITRPCLWMRLCLAWNTTMCLGEFGDSDKYTKGADFRLVKGGENLQMPTVEHHPYKFDLFVTSNLQYVIWMCV